MVVSPLDPRSFHHVRSISLPSRPHPLISEFEEHLCRLRTSEATSSSSISHKLSGLEDLNDCLDSLLLLPLTQQILTQHRHENFVDELMDRSLRLLDVCGTAKDLLLQSKECAHELQSSMRRRRGGENGISTGVEEYSASRKKVKKAIHVALRNLKGMKNKPSFSAFSKDPEAVSMVSMLREVETVTLSVIESVLSSIAGAATQPRTSGWSLVSKVMHLKHVACKEAEVDISEFEKVDAALYTLTGLKRKSINQVHVNSVQNELGNLESNIQDLEEVMQFLSRRLITTRVSLLNILSR